ncbi:MAG: hypothetical protein ACTSWI_03155 [Alphaproteobacteria bacterium]
MISINSPDLLGGAFGIVPFMPLWVLYETNPPHRAETDENGLVRIDAAKGEHTIFVSKAKHDPVRKAVDLTEDVSSRRN